MNRREFLEKVQMLERHIRMLLERIADLEWAERPDSVRSYIGDGKASRWIDDPDFC